MNVRSAPVYLIPDLLHLVGLEIRHMSILLERVAQLLLRDDFLLVLFRLILLQHCLPSLFLPELSSEKRAHLQQKEVLFLPPPDLIWWSSLQIAWRCLPLLHHVPCLVRYEHRFACLTILLVHLSKVT